MFRSAQHDSPFMKGALILVDLQNDFMPGGALAVPHGNEVIPIADELQRRFDLVVATKDWHPRDHVRKQLRCAPPQILQLKDPRPYKIGLERSLYELQSKLIARAKKQRE